MICIRYVAGPQVVGGEGGGGFVLRSGAGGELGAFFDASPTPDAASVLQVRLRRKEGTLAEPVELRTANGKRAVPALFDAAIGEGGRASTLWTQEGSDRAQLAELLPG